MSTQPNTDATGASDDDFVTEGSGNVYLDLGFSEEEAARLQLRSELMHRLARHIKETGMKQQEAADLLGVSQPRISDLVNQKAEKFSLDTLMGMAVKAGAEIGLKVKGLRGHATA